ncbi:hypothetical protein ACETU7_22010 [Rhodococcus sp. 3Y1]
MRDFELDPELARRLAVAAADAPWTLSGLEEAFGTVFGVSPTLLAVRVLDLMPAPPFEPQTLYRLLRELPRLRPVPSHWTPMKPRCGGSTFPATTPVWTWLVHWI